MEDKMQHNSKWSGTLFQGETKSLFKEEENSSRAAISSIKGKEELRPQSSNTMANSEQDGENIVEHQEGESSSNNEAENKEEASDQFENHEEEEEEDPLKVIFEEWWYGDKERDNFFADLRIKLDYLQKYLSFLKAMERDPKYAKLCMGPSSREIKTIMRRYVPMKAKDPGRFFLDVNFANKHIAEGVVDLGASCSIMPFSIYKKIGTPKLNQSNAYLRMADITRKKAMGELKDYLV